MDKSTLPKITDKEIAIIKKAKAGDKLAFNQIFYNYKSFVENILYDYIKDKDEARDIVNVVFVKVHDKLSKFVNYDSFGGWLRILTKNTAIDYLRTIKDKQVYIDTNDWRIDFNQTQNHHESDIINNMTLDNIISKFTNLTQIKRKVLTMYYSDGYTIADISKCLGIPIGTIKSILFRFRKQVFNKLKIK